jgi:hypothetical protein
MSDAQDSTDDETGATGVADGADNGEMDTPESRGPNDLEEKDKQDRAPSIPELGPGEWLLYDPAKRDGGVTNSAHLLEKDHNSENEAGFTLTSVCGNKNSPKHLSPKTEVDSIDAIGIITWDKKFCSSCIRKANVHNYLPDAREIREAVRQHESIDVDADVSVSFSVPVNTEQTMEFLKQVAYVADAVSSERVRALEDEYVEARVSDVDDD